MVAFPCMSTHPFDLAASASAEMIREGFQPGFPTGSKEQVEEIRADGHAVRPGREVRDLRALLWSSIDNDTSRDLDQIEVAESGWRHSREGGSGGCVGFGVEGHAD